MWHRAVRTPNGAHLVVLIRIISFAVMTQLVCLPLRNLVGLILGNTVRKYLKYYLLTVSSVTCLIMYDTQSLGIDQNAINSYKAVRNLLALYLNIGGSYLKRI